MTTVFERMNTWHEKGYEFSMRVREFASIPYVGVFYDVAYPEGVSQEEIERVRYFAELLSKIDTENMVIAAATKAHG